MSKQVTDILIVGVGGQHLAYPQDSGRCGGTDGL